MVMDDILERKQHILVFFTTVGEFVIATDDINSIANEVWFKRFVQIYGPPKVSDKPAPQAPAQQAPQAAPRQPLGPAPAPPQQTRSMQQQAQFDTAPRPPAASQVPPSTFLDIQPDKMGRDIWESLTPEQQSQWMTRWNLGPSPQS